jgi:HAD superfamily hydrolase (TIGR01509 family)
MKNLKLVIFDLDGVLVDACEWHRIALNEALSEVCNYKISEDDHEKTFNGIPTRIKLDILSDMKIISRDCHEEVYKVKQKKTIETIQEKSKNKPEKIKLIKSLKREGLTVCCFTNSIRETAELMLKTAGIIDLFDMIITNQDVKYPKPNPEGYLKILSYFNISSENALIIEDSPKGIEAAILSGCQVIGVKNADDVNLELFSEILK